MEQKIKWLWIHQPSWAHNKYFWNPDVNFLIPEFSVCILINCVQHINRSKKVKNWSAMVTISQNFQIKELKCPGSHYWGVGSGLRNLSEKKLVTCPGTWHTCRHSRKTRLVEKTSIVEKKQVWSLHDGQQQKTHREKNFVLFGTWRRAQDVRLALWLSRTGRDRRKAASPTVCFVRSKS